MNSFLKIVFLAINLLVLVNAKCKNNEEFNDCGNHCSELNCGNLSGGNSACQDICEDGCFCKSGFYRVPKGQNCVKLSECPKNVCDTTESFGCGVKHCELICGEEFNESCMVADFLCKNDCFCKNGFIRDKSGTCIPDVECKNLKTFKSQ